MDIITDLTSRAVSFISVYRDICKSCELEANLQIEQVKGNFEVFNLKDLRVRGKIDSQFHENPEETALRKRNDLIDKLLISLVWKGNIKDNKLILKDLAGSIIFLVDILIKNQETVKNLHYKPEEIQAMNIDSSPYFWRVCFRYMLYQNPEIRIEFAKSLEYIPLLILLAVGGKGKKPYKKRLYQVWGKGAERLGVNETRKYWRQGKKITDECKDWRDWWAGDFTGTSKGKYTDEKSLYQNPNSRINQIFRLLTDDTALLSLLKTQEIPLPFESLYHLEMNEIVKTRNKRTKDGCISDLWPVKPFPTDANDPLDRAKQLQFAGLALSGGGIRSATFNLGIIQKLAELNVLSRFDYLSTVSGGGYIGSWLVSWIYRSGSVTKVSNRLNPKLSSDPMGEEVRPIRWLRMYSNYLSPKTGIMSGDSWTIGMTWLRNAFVNQVILVLLLCTILSAVVMTHSLWHSWSKKLVGVSWDHVLVISAVLLLFGAIITGLAMRVFDRTDSPPSRFKIGSSRLLPIWLVVWATLTGFIGSAWLVANINGEKTTEDYFKMNLPIGISGFFAMIVIAVLGRYHARSKTKKSEWKLWSAVALTSVLSAGFGVWLLALVCDVLTAIGSTQVNTEEYQFIFGTPLVLEATSVCVVCRMALMGDLFPEERREWWGRVGAVVHRFILIWILISASALVLPFLIAQLLPSADSKILPAAIATWSAAIGTAVKLAFQSKSDGDKVTNGVDYVNLFVKFAPYLFMIGFLMIGSNIFEALSYKIFPYIRGCSFFSNDFRTYLALTLILGAITFILSWRVGVNEFSLHHFYRNRLSRAYLGATRRRTSRDSTANRFTGFDDNDDIAMKDLAYDEYLYSGPYPIINTALNATTVSALDRQDRKAESFIFSPLFCGFDFSPTNSAADSSNGIFQYGYRYTDAFSEQSSPTLGTAMAVSGAAVNPNMGYHSSAPTAFLLTIFNVRLGRWIGNPRTDCWNRSNPITGLMYLVKDLIGRSDIENDYVCLSDGGHFDNMGIYELIRRRCTYILLCDAEEDERASCEGLANAIRRCRIDFGVEIDLQTEKITQKDKDTGLCEDHLVSGTITYPGDKKPSGTIVYVKTCLTGKEGVDIREYQMSNKDFPQQSTGDQFFDEAQFESYRQLGYRSMDEFKKYT
ncbi:patatin-like phospholipase family protein [Mucilaginibacter lappiensis]|uniref:patatin-like phospholipase family protein n=1 Tax=Mucilaginibacter lappiensis TaxID=354630 RepID=UPI003D1B67F9